MDEIPRPIYIEVGPKWGDQIGDITVYICAPDCLENCVVVPEVATMPGLAIMLVVVAVLRRIHP